MDINQKRFVSCKFEINYHTPKADGYLALRIGSLFFGLGCVLGHKRRGYFYLSRRFRFINSVNSFLCGETIDTPSFNSRSNSVLLLIFMSMILGRLGGELLKNELQNVIYCLHSVVKVGPLLIYLIGKLTLSSLLHYRF